MVNQLGLRKLCLAHPNDFLNSAVVCKTGSLKTYCSLVYILEFGYLAALQMANTNHFSNLYVCAILRT